MHAANELRNKLRGHRQARRKPDSSTGLSASAKSKKASELKKISEPKKTSLYVGVSWHKATQKWAVQMRAGRHLNFGYFDDEILAALCYTAAAVVYRNGTRAAAVASKSTDKDPKHFPMFIKQKSGETSKQIELPLYMALESSTVDEETLFKVVLHTDGQQYTLLSAPNVNILEEAFRARSVAKTVSGKQVTRVSTSEIKMHLQENAERYSKFVSDALPASSIKDASEHVDAVVPSVLNPDIKEGRRQPRSKADWPALLAGTEEARRCNAQRAGVDIYVDDDPTLSASAAARFERVTVSPVATDEEILEEMGAAALCLMRKRELTDDEAASFSAAATSTDISSSPSPEST